MFFVGVVGARFVFVNGVEFFFEKKKKVDYWPLHVFVQWFCSKYDSPR